MRHFFTLPLKVRSYVIVVVLLGAATLSYSFYDLLTSQMSTQWLVLAILILLTGSFSVKVPGLKEYLSVSETFVFTSVLMFGPEAGAVTVLLECLVILFWMTPDGRPVYRLLFNIAAPAVSIWVSAHALFFIANIPPY